MEAVEFFFALLSASFIKVFPLPQKSNYFSLQSYFYCMCFRLH